MREFTFEDALRLISRMRGMYGKKFVDQWAGVDPQEIAYAMTECLSGLSVQELQAGFDRMKTSVFCPSIPEFRAWCEAASPYLTENEAWLQAVKFDHGNGTTSISSLAKQAYEMVRINKSQYVDANKQNFYAFRDCYLRLVAEAKSRGFKDEVIPAPPQIEYKAVPISKPKFPQIRPEAKAWIDQRAKELEEKGLSVIRALIQATQECPAEFKEAV